MADSPTRAAAPEQSSHLEVSGMWLVVLGSVLAILAPLAGFLGGTIVGSSGVDSEMDPLLLWLIVGLGVGGVGVLIAFLGGLRWHRGNRNRLADG